MERRAFLRLVGIAAGGAAVTAVTPELAQKIVEVAAAEGTTFSLAEVNALCVKHIVPQIADEIFRADPLLTFIKQKHRTRRYSGGAGWR